VSPCSEAPQAFKGPAAKKSAMDLGVMKESLTSVASGRGLHSSTLQLN